GRCLDGAELWRHRARPCHHPQARAHDGRRRDGGERDGQGLSVHRAPPRRHRTLTSEHRRGDRMKRREFITLLGGAATWPRAARAQQGERMRRIGVLAGGAIESAADTQERNAAFAQTLQQLGWTNGDNVRIDYRYGLGNAANVRKYAAELVSLAPD